MSGSALRLAGFILNEFYLFTSTPSGNIVDVARFVAGKCLSCRVEQLSDSWRHAPSRDSSVVGTVWLVRGHLRKWAPGL
jgi:hypothetical protein